ncbi:selenoprotein p [Plakobranchus ocellatus]|uniref:Selenoprotein p n=1 Tax=Plakobranchus ocellatus TaxID=259542 RepID=A0AAV3ZJL8_9GAST|nr:selenoprotein p [Plakobranchus ocellatus]
MSDGASDNQRSHSQAEPVEAVPSIYMIETKRPLFKMSAGKLILLCTIALIIGSQRVTSQNNFCQVPVWPSSLGDDPIQQNAGKVLLVALMKGYCQYCWHQAHNLELLKNHLLRVGYPDIAMVIINGGEAISRNQIGNLRAHTNLTVYQDREDNILYNQVFDAGKDDFVIFDRCGHRVAYIPHPYSYLGHTITERVLRQVHRGRHHCPCSADPPSRRGRRAIRYTGARNV